MLKKPLHFKDFLSIYDSLLERVSQPNGVTHTLHIIQFQESGRSVCILDAIEHLSHALSSVDARPHHHAYMDEALAKKHDEHVIGSHISYL